MSDLNGRTRPECDPYADELAELALGILLGRERARVLAHVDGCSSCHAEMEQLSLAADSLLEVVPRVEPPLGFEVRLMDHLGAGSSVRRQMRWQWRFRQSSLVFACALLVAAIGVGMGWVAWGHPRQPIVHAAFGTERGGRIETESLLAGGHAIGTVVVYSGRTSWLYMTVDDGSWSGRATCQVRLANGRTVLLGTFWLDNGYGAWGAALPSGTSHIVTASVVTNGGTLASGNFPSA